MLRKLLKDRGQAKAETPTSRRSFFVDMMSWGAGLYIAAAGLSACSDDADPTAKYGGPPDGGPPDDLAAAYGADMQTPDMPMAKYGGPPDLGGDSSKVDMPMAKYGGPADLGVDGPVAKYGGPQPWKDLGVDGPMAKYGGPPPTDAG